ncbi:MAG: 4Fe-4S dicluster domain-containing protein [Deltaproteobacteria bacterium]|jgi:Na+-translocating ferredoxin:NAD+ oxidoreductase RnfC subunit
MAEERRSGVFIDADHPLVRQVKAAGVIGSGGAGFPTHVKLSAQVPNFIINGAECEPLIRVDQQLLVMYPDKLNRVLQTVVECVGAECVYLAVKAKYKEVVEEWSDRLNPPDQVFQLDDFYPAGDEQTLICEILQRIVPEMGIPTDVGALVHNVETLLNVAAAMDGHPVTYKYVTVGGGVQNPITVRAPVGTPYRDLVEIAGGVTIEDPVYYDGGLMTGRHIASLDNPVTKTTKAILAIPSKLRCVQMRSLDRRSALRQVRAGCDQCRMCTDLCPRYLLGHTLEPHLIMRQAAFNELSERIKDMSLLCCDCGVCEIYSCPVGIPPRTFISHIKNEEMAAGRRFEEEKRLPEYHERIIRRDRRVPAKRLIEKLGVKEFDKPAPFLDQSIQPIHLRLLMKQHIGRPADPRVREGDRVEAEQVIGEIPEGEFGAHVHTPLKGIVREVTEKSVLIEVA